MWATWVTSGARPAGQGGMLGAEEGPGRQEGRGVREKGKEEKGKLLGADPEVGYWAKPQASTPLFMLIILIIMGAIVILIIISGSSHLHLFCQADKKVFTLKSNKS